MPTSSRPVDHATVVDAATLSLLRVALAFGLLNSVTALSLCVAGLSRRPLVLGLGLLWVSIWGWAVAHPSAMLTLLRRHTWAVTVVATLAAMATTIVTGGFESPISTNVEWLGWAATVVASARKSLIFAVALGVAILTAYLAAGMPVATLIGPDRYQLVTELFNPLVIVLVALALAGVFRSVIAAVPGTLWRIRHGGPASTPALTALLSRPAQPLLPAGAAPTTDLDPSVAAVASTPPPPPPTLLSDQERSIIRLLADGLVPKQIAQLSGSTNTAVYDRIASAKRKTGAQTIEHLVALTLVVAS